MKFISFSILGSITWVIVFLGGGFLFGNIPVIKEHLSLVILCVMIVSILPIIKMIVDEIKHNKK
jgi:membrane-associated protein